MTIIKIEFPAGDCLAARAFGNALLQIAGDKTTECVVPEPDPKPDPAPSADPTSSGSGDTSASADGASPEVDEFGVPFDREFCAQAKVPFYGSGKRKGQWKKRQGVTDDDYDEWYAGQRFADKIEDTEPVQQQQQYDAGAVFGGQQQQAPANDAPQDMNSLMKWVAESTASGLITQHQATAAYAETGVTYQDLLDPAKAPAACAKLYNHLNAQVRR